MEKKVKEENRPRSKDKGWANGRRENTVLKLKSTRHVIFSRQVFLFLLFGFLKLISNSLTSQKALKIIAVVTLVSIVSLFNIITTAR
jgi:hypothetical protein